MDRGAWQATVHGIAKVGLDLVTKPQPPISSSRKGRKVHMCAYTDTQTCTHTHTHTESCLVCELPCLPGPNFWLLL